jgi:hypothetical protein
MTFWIILFLAVAIPEAMMLADRRRGARHRAERLARWEAFQERTRSAGENR